MSLYSALYAGVSGLNAQSSAMATVADNITNINTIGYKSTEAQFRTLVTDGRSKNSYSAGGVAAVPVAMISKQGLVQASGSNTDIAIDGGGFFVTRTTTDGEGQVAYTRAGAFRPDEEGYLRNASQLYLYGWRLDNSGNYTNNGDLDSLEPVRLSDLTGTASPTSRLQLRMNLESDAPNYTADATANPPRPAYTAGSMASGAIKPTYSRPFTAYDSQGNSHQMTLSFLKTGANEWKMEVSMPAGEVTAPGGLLRSGEISFNGDGSLDMGGSSAGLFDAINVNYTNGAGSAPIELALGADKSMNGLSSSSDISALISSNINGGVLGNLDTVEIDKTGRVRAIFEDGTSRDVFQIPIATFQNPDGMARMTGNAFSITQASGNATLLAPGALGAGSIAASSLEASTVDLAAEFTNMIRFQRAYSASSKIITTVDDMLREVSDLKR